MIPCIGLEISYPSGMVNFAWYSTQEERSAVIMQLIAGEPIEGCSSPSKLVSIIDHVTEGSDAHWSLQYDNIEFDDDYDPLSDPSVIAGYCPEAQEDLARHDMLFPNGYVDPLGDAMDDDIPF